MDELVKNLKLLRIIVALIIANLFFIQCSSTINSKLEYSRIQPGLYEEYLVLNESILLDFYSTIEKKAEALNLLRFRCSDESVKDAHACYNLSVLLGSMNEWKESYQYMQLGVKWNSKDHLYLEQLRFSASESNQVNTLENTYPNNGKVILIYTNMIQACKNKNESLTVQYLDELQSKNLITYEYLQSGILLDCISENKMKEYKSKLPRNKVNYQKLFEQEKNKSHSFYSVWDTSYYTKKSSLEKEETINNKLTLYWKDFKVYLSKKDISRAKEQLNFFKEELANGKKQDKKNLNLYTAIERAAKLLLEQEPFFKDVSHLSQEF